MGEAAVAAARAVGYVGAGTVEFIVEPDGAEGHFYFMEMNTRLQVEHPVTEMVTGLDLVAWQLRVAAGEPLPLTQAALTLSGHAIEARIYAENPAREFLPSTGTLRYLAMPAAVEFSVGPASGSGSGSGIEQSINPEARAAVRIDSGIRPGDTISPFYDPMLAKLIVWGSDRDQALSRMARALREFEVVGLHTNLEFLERIVTSAPFVQADLDTGLIERHHASLFAAPPPPTAETLALALAALLAREATAAGTGAASQSPWASLGGWRLNGPDTRVLGWTLHEADDSDAPPNEIILQSDTGGLRLQIAGSTGAFTWQRGKGAAGALDHGHDFSVALDGRQAAGRVVAEGNVFHVFHQGRAWAIVWQDPLAHAGGAVLAHGKLTAPMPGKVIAVLAQGGARVEKGAPLLVMEAMKMEHTIAAPADGLVDEVFFAVGDQVQEGAQLLTFTADA
jgi:3-methylcrotonyl-CoA carboxylase alpha subunit